MDYTQRIDIMRHNLIHIRKTLGMTATKFGALIGVTRQTVNNIESGRNVLTQPVYMAFLYALEKEIFPNCDAAEREMVERLLVEKVVRSDYRNSLTFEEG